MYKYLMTLVSIISLVFVSTLIQCDGERTQNDETGIEEYQPDATIYEKDPEVAAAIAPMLSLPKRVEVDLTYDLLPGIDQKAYSQWAKKAIGYVLTSPGIIEFRAYRNLIDVPYVKATSVWMNMYAWTKFAESSEWQTALSELRDQFADNINVEVWGQSPVAPRPLRPKKASPE